VILRTVLAVKAFAAGKSIVVAWLLAGISTFGVLDANIGSPTYAVIWAAISALGAAAITGITKVIVNLINTSRSRREQGEVERAAEIERLHDFYALRLAFAADQLRNETNILRVVRNAKHELLSDIGARDAYIDTLEDVLRENDVKFDRMKFRNTAEAFAEENQQVAEIVRSEIVKSASPADGRQN
jgi:hypothetical protein